MSDFSLDGYSDGGDAYVAEPASPIRSSANRPRRPSASRDEVPRYVLRVIRTAAAASASLPPVPGYSPRMSIDMAHAQLGALHGRNPGPPLPLLPVSPGRTLSRRGEEDDRRALRPRHAVRRRRPPVPRRRGVRLPGSRPARQLHPEHPEERDGVGCVVRGQDQSVRQLPERRQLRHRRAHARRPLHSSVQCCMTARCLSRCSSSPGSSHDAGVRVGVPAPFRFHLFRVSEVCMYHVVGCGDGGICSLVAPQHLFVVTVL